MEFCPFFLEFNLRSINVPGSIFVFIVGGFSIFNYNYMKFFFKWMINKIVTETGRDNMMTRLTGF